MARTIGNPTTRDKQARDTRERIYEAAWVLIGAEGFDKVSVDRICESAGVAKGSFYHHFKSKADLIVEGYSLCDRYFDEQVAGRLTATDASGRIVEFVAHQMRYAVSMGIDLIRQVYKSQLENGTRFFVSMERSLPRILRAVVAEGQSSGQLRSDLDPDYVTGYVLRFSRGTIYDWCLREGSYDLEAVAVEACRRLVSIFVPD
ncbi:MAG: TetR/AcrR family transcriptional regulator [Spirochaetes bacterium]|nr:TetR/AcrR family transcriptional regulator [Spirochaetota bacterium]